MNNVTIRVKPHGYQCIKASVLLLASLLLAGCGGGGGGGGGGNNSTGTAPGTTLSTSDTGTTPDVPTAPANTRPVATGSCRTVNQENQNPGLVGNLAATDEETPTMLSYSLLNPDGSDAGLNLTTANGGTVTITDPTTGSFTYQADTRPGNKRGIDTFDYQVSDPEGATTRATETVIVSQKIMPLGDSITMGSDSTGGKLPFSKRVGYRFSLHEQLTSSNYMVDFVGSLESGSEAIPRLDDDDHEGHGGWTAFDIAWGRVMNGSDGVFAWLEQNPADFILLHIGTNDLDNARNDVVSILDEIDRWENSANGNPVTVVIARIIDWAPINPDVNSVNNSVEKMVNRRKNDNIIIVDQQIGAGLNYTVGADMSDQVHPNSSGYNKMADIWFSGLSPLLDKCP